jgi:hypothetical protein
MSTIASVITAAAILSGGAYAVARAQERAHVLQALKDAQWGPPPAFVPPGAQLAVLSGDPTRPAPYAVRLKFPAYFAYTGALTPGVRLRRAGGFTVLNASAARAPCLAVRTTVCSPRMCPRR